MMFSMLIEPLLKEASHIGIITYDRLTDLYKRAFPDAEIFDTKNLRDGSIKADNWDVQVAMGSLPMLRHPHLEDFKEIKPYLIPDGKQKDELKNKYLSQDEAKLAVGFSWKGGGNAKP